MKVRKKPLVLDAKYAECEGYIDTKEGRMSYYAGDVIMTGAHGERYPIQRAIFDDTYDVLTPGIEIPGEVP